MLVTIDTTRADRIGCYGLGAAAGTPHLDALAARGARFEDARTTVPLTLPSHATILTGLYPPSHGLHDNGLVALSDRAVTLADLLSSYKVRNGAFVSSFVLSARFGLDQGFDHYDEVKDVRLLNGGLMQERPAGETVDAALEWVADVEGPYFLWVHLFDPHSPYRPPEPYLSRFSSDPYQGEIAYADAEIGRLMTALEGRADGPPLVVITSDHGEALGEHGERTHGAFVYDATLHVPLLIAGPGVREGNVIPDAVSTADLMPTVLDLLRLPIPAGLDGVSFARTLRGEGRTPRDPLYFETYWGFFNQGWSPLLGVTDGRQKWIDAPIPERFDLSADPHELENLLPGVRGAESPSPTLDEMSTRMRSAARAIHARQGDLADARALTAAERKTLEELGYISGGTGGSGLPLPTEDLPDPKERIHLQDVRDRALDLLARHDQSADPTLLEDALAILLPALVEDPKGAVLNEFAGLVYARQGRLALSIPHLRTCLERRPDNLDARYVLAWSLLGEKQTDRAIEELERCVRDEPDFVKAAGLLGKIHEDAGRSVAAIGWYEHFLEHWPEDDAERSDVRGRLLRLKDSVRRPGG